MMTKRILIVDDINANLYMLRSLLEGEGFEVDAARNGQEALDKAHATPPDLIVSDILMPVMDGYALCRQCKSDEQLNNVPFVFYTGSYTEPKDEKFALSLGADRFILKPQEPEIFMSMLLELFEEKYVVKVARAQPLGEEMEFFRRHNEILFAKLEKKMLDLEAANKELKCLEEQYRLSFENVTDIVWTIDADCIVRKMSPSVERVLGYKPRDLIGRPISDLVKIFVPESTERAMTETGLVLNGGTIRASVYSLVAKDGAVKYGEISGSPILSNGKIVGMVSVVRDITERKQMEEALENERTLLRSLIDNVPDRIYAKDSEGLFMICNEALVRRMGKTSMTEIVGKSDFDFLPPELAQRFHADEQAVIRSGTPIINREEPLATEDGKATRWNLATKVPLLDKQGNRIGVVGVGREITDLKLAAEALRESEEKYRLLFNNAGEAILVIQGGVLKFVNPATVMLTGYSEEALLSKPFTEFIYPEDREMVFEQYRKRMRGEDVPSTYAFRAVTQGGSVKWAEIRATLVTWEGKPATLNFLSDVTEHKRAEEALRESEEKYRSIFEHSQDAILLSRPDGAILDANRSACEMFGRSADELRAVGRNGLVDITDPRLQAALEERARMGRARAEITMIRANGDKFIADIASTIFTDIDGQQKTSMIIRDITERNRAEEALRKSEARFRSYFELPLIGIAITSPKKGWLEVNDRVTDILGYSWEELREKTWAELTYPEDLDADVEQFNRVLAGEIDSYMLDKRFVRKDGDVIWVSLAAGCVRKQDGTVDYFVVIIEDISSRKESVERIRRTLGATVHAIAVTVETRDPYTAGHQRRVSDLARSIASEMGLDTDQIEGVRTAGIIHDLGKISVPAELLSKPTRLTETEFSLIKTHAQSGYEILKDIEFPWPVARMVLEHHERMDGSGYPKGLKGDALLLESRILAVADVVESMASHRPYRPSLGQDAALEEITRNMVTLYDPVVVDACLRLFNEKGYKMAY
jgi:PAS domain S-box-containing protein/putative nucleotidyltransferase with HDIG domain